MTAFAALSLLNNAAVAQTFVPVGIDSAGVAKWMTTTETVFDARRQATMLTTLPKNGSNVFRLKQRVVIPVMDTVDPTKKIAEAYVNIEFVIPKQANTTQRLDLRAYADEFVKNAVSTAAITNFEGIY